MIQRRTNLKLIKGGGVFFFVCLFSLHKLLGLLVPLANEPVIAIKNSFLLGCDYARGWRDSTIFLCTLKQPEYPFGSSWSGVCGTVFSLLGFVG